MYRLFLKLCQKSYFILLDDKGFHHTLFERQVLKAKMKGAFSGSYCCYGNLLCYGKDNNVFTNSWEVFSYHDCRIT